MDNVAADNFDHEGAADYLRELVNQFGETIDEILADEERSALDEEGESAEHPLLDNIRAGAEQPPDPFGQVFVIRHAMDGSPPVRPSARARRDGSR